MKLTVNFKGKSQDVEIEDHLPVIDFQHKVEEATGIPPEMQKLLVAKSGMVKIDKLEHKEETPMKDVTKDGSKIMVIGTSMDKIQDLRDAEQEDAQRKEKMNKRLANMAKHGKRAVVSRDRNLVTSEYTFDRVEPLNFLPRQEEARAYLHKIKNDRGVQAVMEKYKWKVGLLTELDPAFNTNHESRKLGQNRNKGEVIEIRIRTDDYGGWCEFKEVIKVVCHELAHNEFSEHDRNFWDLCNKLEKEVKDLDPFGHKGQQLGADVYNGPGLWDQPAENLHCDDGGIGGGSEVLGGSDEEGSLRDKMLRAAEKRRRK